MKNYFLIKEIIATLTKYGYQESDIRQVIILDKGYLTWDEFKKFATNRSIPTIDPYYDENLRNTYIMLSDNSWLYRDYNDCDECGRDCDYGKWAIKRYPREEQKITAQVLVNEVTDKIKKEITIKLAWKFQEQLKRLVEKFNRK